jgi:hypothetical protein
MTNPFLFASTKFSVPVVSSVFCCACVGRAPIESTARARTHNLNLSAKVNDWLDNETFTGRILARTSELNGAASARDLYFQLTHFIKKSRPAYNLFVRLTPIFDTSSLINLSRGESLDLVVKRLKPLIPSHGCPLSFVTTVELFRGLSKGNPEKVADTLKPLLLAAHISRRVVLRVPLTFARWELFRVEEALLHSPKLLMYWLALVQAPKFAERFASGEVTMDFNELNRIFEKIEREESRETEVLLDRWNPDWRVERRNGSALPEKLRNEAKRGMQFDALKDAMPELFLKQMEIERTPSNIQKAKIHCDAYFAFQVDRLRASVLGNYAFERKSNDFHDWLQLLYLTRSNLCLVTDDRPSVERTRQSSQSSRIMSLDEFLSGAAASAEP